MFRLYEAKLIQMIARGNALRPMERLRPLWKKRYIGITGRLMISFGAVAILAAAANLIVEGGIAVVRTRHLDREFASPLAYIAKPSAALIVEPPAPPVEHERPDRLLAMAAAVERYRKAIEDRAAAGTLAASAELAGAEKNLVAVSTTALAIARPDRSNASFAQRARLYVALGNAYVGLAEDRRRTFDDYVRCADSINERLTGVLDHSWRIFGRVLARQSLLRLHTEIDELRRNIARITVPETDQVNALDAAKASEASFAATFQKNSESLSRSEGNGWVGIVRADLERAVRLRESIVRLAQQSHELMLNFEAARGGLLDSISKERVLGGSRQPGDTLPAATQPKPVVSIAAPLNSPIVETVTTTSTRTGGPERRLVAWITAAVLTVLLVISLSTIYSIVVPVRRMLKATERIADGDVDVRVASGGITELAVLGSSFNRMAAQLATARDMTRDYQQKLEEQVEQRTRQLQHLAEHDPLTLLPNRRQLFMLLNHALDRARQNGRHVAVFFIDIDNFKNLNDSKGHAFGDKVLAEIAGRMQATARSFGFAARLGGDEFTVVYEDAPSIDAVRVAGCAVVDAFDKPLRIDGHDVVVQASVGASVYPDHGGKADVLLSAADVALFRAKTLGRRQLVVFTPELLEAASRKFTIEQSLRLAIERNEFELVFQPEVSLDALNMVLVESLVRWRLPDGRRAMPAEFLAVTEESGLIVELGNWVLREAIRAAAAWHHGEWPDARVAINVSPRQLADPRFASTVLDLLREFHLPPRCIELELTESVLQTGLSTIDTLRYLRSQDIAVALDDFGTGYSSLASLEALPLTRIKLDRSLIASIDTNPRSAAITRALVSLCQSLGLEMTAEGVERSEQFAALTEYRSIHLQGYLISKPIAGDAVVAVARTIPAVMQNLLLSNRMPVPAAQNTDSAAEHAQGFESAATKWQHRFIRRSRHG